MKATNMWYLTGLADSLNDECVCSYSTLKIPEMPETGSALAQLHDDTRGDYNSMHTVEACKIKDELIPIFFKNISTCQFLAFSSSRYH